MGKIKRSIALRIICSVSAILYVGFVCLYFIKPFYLHNAWFSVAIGLIGLCMIVKGFFYYLDSAFFLGFLFYFSSLVGIYNTYFPNQFGLVLYFCAFALASLLNFFIFRQNIKFILFVLSFFQVIILLVDKLLQSKLIFWLIESAFILLIIGLIVISIFKAKETKTRAISK